MARIYEISARELGRRFREVEDRGTRSGARRPAPKRCCTLRLSASRGSSSRSCAIPTEHGAVNVNINIKIEPH
jgi:hypothetical protein